jgi:hypothetical protein
MVFTTKQFLSYGLNQNTLDGIQLFTYQLFSALLMLDRFWLLQIYLTF